MNVARRRAKTQGGVSSPSRTNRLKAAGGPGRCVFIVPGLLAIVLLYAAMGYVGLSSLWEGTGVTFTRFVGVDNFLRVARDPVFFNALRNSAVYTVVVIVATMTIGFLMALLLASGIRARAVYKVIWFYPTVLAASIVAGTWQVLLDPSTGFLDHPWLGDSSTALAAVSVMSIWAGVGVPMIFYTAALNQIDREILEAAQVDGAGRWTVVRKIIAPMLWRVHAVLVILGTIVGLQAFEIIFLATRGGPGRSTEVLGIVIVRESAMGGRFGYAAAVSVLLLIIALVLSVLQLRAFRSRQ